MRADINPATLVVGGGIAGGSIAPGEKEPLESTDNEDLALELTHTLSLVRDVDYSGGFKLPEDLRLSWQRAIILGGMVIGIVVNVMNAENEKP